MFGGEIDVFGIRLALVAVLDDQHIRIPAEQEC
jgi:hypothetical protein